MQKILYLPLLLAPLLLAATSPLLGLGREEAEDILPPGFVLKFERIGGYGGVHDFYWIYPDGRAINGRGEAANLPRDVVDDWRRILADPQMPAPWRELPMEALCADCVVYRITVYGDEGKRTIKTASNLLKEDANPVAAAVASMRDRLLGLSWSPFMDLPEVDDED